MDVTYQALHARIYHLYSDGQFLEEAEPSADSRRIAAYVVRAAAVWPWAGTTSSVNVIVLRPTSSHERWRFSGNDEERITRVAALPTLDELSASEIDDCVYAGAKITAEYLPRICTAANLTSCPAVDLGKVPRCRR
jgi:hypothetical protein